MHLAQAEFRPQRSHARAYARARTQTHTHTHSAAGASICRWRWRTTRTLLTLTLLSMASWCCSTSMSARAHLFAVYLLVCNCGRFTPFRRLFAPCAVVSVCGCGCACVLSFSLCQSLSLSLSLSVNVSCLSALHACTVTRGRAGVRAFEIDGRLVLAQLPHKAAPVGQRLGHGIDSSPRLVVRENG